MHNTEDCVWLTRQNAQCNNCQDLGCQSHAAQPSTNHFQTNSNNIRSQHDWRPRRRAPPQRRSNPLPGSCNYFYEGNPFPRPNDFVQNTYSIYPNANFMPRWEQHIHYNAAPAPYLTMPTDSSSPSSQSSELPLALPALPSSSTLPATSSDAHTGSQSTSSTNMIIPSKEIASTPPIISPGIVCWNATTQASRDPCHICLSVCQIDNLTPSTKTFVRKYASMRAFQIPIKLGIINAHALIDTNTQCFVLSSDLVKCAFDKQSLQLLICGKIKVADGAIINAHGPVVVTMESAFSEHMIKMSNSQQ
uniref:Uncharacterized protein n=1 Tax=Romanomermis culicivorax TaxID=13658 RepID=A0A915HHX8_ROMCU